MNATQQIDALRALGTSDSSSRRATSDCLDVKSPNLTAISSALGAIGGLIVCLNDFDMRQLYLYKVTETVKFYDYLSGLEVLIFGGIITIVARYRAFRTSEGTRGVGESTTAGFKFDTHSHCKLLLVRFFVL